jgi:hypothetical protein
MAKIVLPVIAANMAACGFASFRDDDGQGGIPVSGVADYAVVQLRLCAEGKLVIPAGGLLSGFCMTPVSAGRMSCTTETDCLEREECVCGECRLRPCTSVECQAGLMCDGRSGRCLKTCPIPTSCPDGTACYDGYCFPDCGDDFDCAAGEFCDTIPCDNDAACPVGDACDCPDKAEGICGSTGTCGGKYCLAIRCKSGPECDPARFDSCTAEGMTLSAPAAVETESGVAMLLERRSSDGRADIVRADSADGVSWEVDPAPVIEPDAPWEGTRTGSPSLFFDGGQAVLYYAGGDGAGIGLAVSDDGLSWRKADVNPVFSVQGSGSEKPCVDHSDCPGGERCYTRTCLARWERGRVGAASVMRAGDTYLMFYEGGQGAGIGLAWAKDGIAFERFQDDPVLDAERLEDPEYWYDIASVGAPHVVTEARWDGTLLFKMWFAALGKESKPNPTNLDPRANLSIGFAASQNAVSWTPYKFNPVFDHIVLLNHLSESEPSVVQFGEKFYLYYSDPDTGALGAAVTGLKPTEWLEVK